MVRTPQVPLPHGWAGMQQIASSAPAAVTRLELQHTFIVQKMFKKVKVAEFFRIFHRFMAPRALSPPVGSRSPDGSDQIPRWAGGWVLHQATLEFWVRFPNEKTGRHPVLKYQVHRSPETKESAIMARRRRRRPPGGHTTAAGSGGRRAHFSTDTASHTHTARLLDCPLLTLSSGAHSPTAFSGPMARPPLCPPRPPPSHIHAGWIVSATKKPTSSAPYQDYLFPLYM
jgi:hypothetical protein